MSATSATAPGSDYFESYGKQYAAESIRSFARSAARYKTSRYMTLKGSAYDGGYRLAAYFGLPAPHTLGALVYLAEKAGVTVTLPKGERHAWKSQVIADSKAEYVARIAS